MVLLWLLLLSLCSSYNKVSKLIKIEKMVEVEEGNINKGLSRMLPGIERGDWEWDERHDEFNLWEQTDQ